MVNLLKKNSRAPPEGSACLICGIRQFVSPPATPRSSRIIPVEIRSFESVGRGSSFYPEKLFAGVLAACARARNCTFKFRSSRLSFSLSLANLKEMVLMILRHDRRARISVFILPSRAILFFEEQRRFSARGIPRAPICILKQQTLEYALITRRNGSTYSKVKVAARYGRGEPFCKFQYFIVPSGAFNSPLLLALSGRVYGASRTFDKL